MYVLVQLEKVATVAVLAAGFIYALTPPASALRFFYLITSLVGCFGRMTKLVWLPFGEISAVGLLLQYCRREDGGERSGQQHQRAWRFLNDKLGLVDWVEES